MFVMSTRRPSAVVQDQGRKGLPSTFCLRSVTVLQFKLWKERGRDGQESVEVRVHLAQ